jgi:hypothetical protein
MEIRQSLADARRILGELVFGEPVLDSVTYRGESDNLSRRRLIAADVIVAGAVEVWYELSAERTLDHPDSITFILDMTSDTPLPDTATVLLDFGRASLEVALDENGQASWTMPETSVIDRKSKTLRGPTAIILRGV